MTPYQQSIEAAKSWKEAVGAMWKRQRIMLYLGIACLALLFVGMALLFSGLSSIEDAPSAGTPLLIFGIVVLLIMLAPAITSVVMMWIFYFDVRRWQNAAPESLKKSIKLFSLGLLTTLIAAAASGVIGGFTTVPFIGGAAEVLSSLIEGAGFAGMILEFIAIIRLRKADDMPEFAKQGAQSLFINYIISFVVTAVGSIIMVFAIISLAFNTLDNYDDIDSYDSNFSNIWTDVDEEYDDYEEFEDSDNVFLSGIWDSMADEFTDEEDLAFLNSLEDAEGAIAAFIIALVIMIGGGIVAMYYYYRGWWLISKSELPVLPEPIDDEVGQEVAYEEVEVVEKVEVIEEKQHDTNY